MSFFSSAAKRLSLIFCIILLLGNSVVPATFTVTNTSDRGDGSLRQAIDDANTFAGPDTIVFHIPRTDPNFSSSTGVWTFRPTYTLPALTDNGTFIDGTSQAIFSGEETNAIGPELEIDGANAGYGLYILSANNTIRNLIINRCLLFGIYLEYGSARENKIQGCFIGTDASGGSSLGNKLSGIILYNGPKKNVIGGYTPAERNIISGNVWAGVEIQGLEADSNLVIGNYIGTDVTGLVDLGNAMNGVYVWSGPVANVIGGSTESERNLISGNGWSGIEIGIGSHTLVRGNYIGTNRDGTEKLANDGFGIAMGQQEHAVIGGAEAGAGNLICGNSSGIRMALVTHALVTGNYIGTNADRANNLGNLEFGIKLSEKASNNVIGPNNVIAYNGSHGVLVEGDSTIQNTITQNSIAGNTGLGIETLSMGNIELNPPVITSFAGSAVSGTAPAGSKVEIFSDDDFEGLKFEGSAVADDLGHFLWSGTASGPSVTATATDEAGNTSEFSAPVLTHAAQEDEMEPVEMTELGQNYPNPFNAATAIAFSVPRTTHAELSILNLAGEEVERLLDQTVSPGFYRLRWQATGQTSGIYWYRLRTGDGILTRRMILLK